MIKKVQSSPIQSTKHVLGGTKVFRGTRVPISTLIDYLEAGDSIDQFLKDFPTVEKFQTIQVLSLLKKTLLKR